MPELAIVAACFAFGAVVWTAGVFALLRISAPHAAGSEAGILFAWLLIPSPVMAGVALLLTIVNGAVTLAGA